MIRAMPIAAALCAFLRVVLVHAAALAPPATAATPQDDIIGIPTLYLTREEDTLLDIARQYDLGYVEIRAAARGIDPWLPGAGRVLALPTAHIIPTAPRRGIVINLAELRLYYFPARAPPQTFPLGIGGEGKETPVGSTRIVRKAVRPTWIPTKSEHDEDPDLPAEVPPGPDNPMGDYALYLGWTGYAIHGTNKPYSIGRRDSHGCIRMYPEDIEKLHRMVAVGTPVTVVDQPVKLGWSGGELFLEIHPGQSAADVIETEGAQPARPAPDIEQLVLHAAGGEAGRLDWYAIELAAERQDGAAVRITRPR